MRTRRHALGQNFLHHKPTIDRIVELASNEMQHATESGRKPGALLEIGPGRLAITRGLVDLAATEHLPLVLVERDRHLEEDIRQGVPDVRLQFMDAAAPELPALFEKLKQENSSPVFVVSNLPYSAASQILANLCHVSTQLSGCVVMVQKEMALRMVAPAKTGHRGALSLLLQSYFQLEWAFDVGPGAFSPPPKVMSTVLALRPLAKPLTADLTSPLKFEHFCKMLFSQRRKMIRKILPPEKHALFPKLDISGTERPEELELSTVLALFSGGDREGT